MHLAERDSHIEDLTSHLNKLKSEFKILQDEYDKINKTEIDQMLALKEQEMAKENAFLKESLESLGIEMIKLTEIKKREFKQRDKLCKYEQDIEDLVIENTRLALSCAKLDKCEMDRADLAKRLDELLVENEQLVAKNRDLNY